MTSEVEI